MSTGSSATHASLLQPFSMQNLIAMACMGQSPLSPTASSQTLSSAQLGTAATPLCMLSFFLIQYFFPIVKFKNLFYHLFKQSRISKISNHLIIFIGSVQDYTTAALPQYNSGLYAPTLTTANALNTTASLVAGKQIEGKLRLHWITELN